MIPEVVQAAFDRNETDLLGKDGVVLVGMGKKFKNGVMTDEDALIVFVKKKKPLAQLLNPVPPAVYARWYNWVTVPTDVVEHKGEIRATDWGKVVARETTRKQRPALGGNSCSHYLGTAGTLGVAARYGNVLALFTNNHVAAQSNDAKVNDPIYQPGPYDGGKATDHIADLYKWVPLKFDKSANYVDAAIAMPRHAADLGLGIMARTESEIIIPDGFHAFAVGERGWKRGRTTDYTELRCIAVGATVNVGYGGKTAQFRGCEIFDPAGASAGGDSGSVIMYGNKMGSHLFAGSDEVTVGTPMAKAFELLGLTVAKPEPVPVPEPEPTPEPEPEPEPTPEPDQPIEPRDLVIVYLDGQVVIRARASVENGKIVVR